MAFDVGCRNLVKQRVPSLVFTPAVFFVSEDPLRAVLVVKSLDGCAIVLHRLGIFQWYVGIRILRTGR
jgi:hypothetical protein